MRQITLWLCAVLASLSLAMSGTSAMAELPPRPDGPVLDAAGEPRRADRERREHGRDEDQQDGEGGPHG